LAFLNLSIYPVGDGGYAIIDIVQIHTITDTVSGYSSMVLFLFDIHDMF